MTQRFLIVSFPKSGRTWLRLMLDLLNCDVAVSHDGSDYKGPDRWSSSLLPFHSGSKHRVIFLHRDPRDTIVSYWFEMTRRQALVMTDMWEFLLHPKFGFERILEFNTTWLRDTSSKLILTYEDMTYATRSCIRSLLIFGEHDFLDTDLNRVLEATKFEQMRVAEQSGTYVEKYGKALKPKNPLDPESFKVRRGEIDGYLKYLTEDQQIWCHTRMLEANYQSTILDGDSRWGYKVWMDRLAGPRLS